jgi:CBS domain-containing protein
VGASTDPVSESYLSEEKLLSSGLEIVPVLPAGWKTYLGLPCYASVTDIPGELDMVHVYPAEGMDLMALAREAAARRVAVFWVESGTVDPEIKNLLADGHVQVVEHESLETEYFKHFPDAARGAAAHPKRSITVSERMTKNPVTVSPREGIRDAIEKMKRGRFRHLPVVNDEGKLVGVLSDRDIRLIRPSLAFVSHTEAAVQLWSTAVDQAAVFNPVVIAPHASLEQAAEMMLRWDVGGLPVVDESGKAIGIITYTDLLREFVARGKELISCG